MGDFGDLWDPDTARAVAPVPDGSVRVGTAAAGLVHWDADGNDYRRYTPPALAGQSIDHVAVAADGTVWAANQAGANVDGDGGVVRYDGDEPRSAPTGSATPSAPNSRKAALPCRRSWPCSGTALP